MATPVQTSLSNQSLTFEAFNDNEKLQITEIAERVNARLKTPVSEQTIRRAIKALVKSGFIRENGRQNNAQLYSKVSVSWVDANDNEKLIPLAGNLTTVAEFLELIADEQTNPYPFTVKVKPENWAISDTFQRNLRRRLAAVVMTSVSPGFNSAIQHHASFLHNHIAELEHLLDVMKTFANSPVWYAQYRDRISRELRKMQEDRPELWQLVNDYVKGD